MKLKLSKNLLKRNVKIFVCLLAGILGESMFLPAIISSTLPLPLIVLSVLTVLFLCGFAISVVFRFWNIIACLKPMTNKISLTEDDFKCLVRGGMITAKSKGGDVIMLVLQDIGFARMDIAIDSAMKGIDIYKNHERGF